MPKVRLTRSRRLRKRHAAEVLHSAHKAIVNANLTSPRPQPVRIVARDANGTLRLVISRHCSSDPDKLGRKSAVGKPGRSLWEDGGRRVPKAPQPRWTGCEHQTPRTPEDGCTGSLGASRPLPEERVPRKRKRKPKA